MFKLILPVVHNIIGNGNAASKNILCCCTTTNVLYPRLLRAFSVQPEIENHNQEKVINVAIVGLPNAGKSTLINSLIDRRVCAASNKVHTTNKLSKAFYTVGDTQVIFLDTPGVVTKKEEKKFKLTRAMMLDVSAGLNNADAIGIIQDVSNTWTRDSLHPLIVELLNKRRDIPSFLILNKIDILKSKRKLLDVLRILSNGLVAGKPVECGSKLIKRRPVDLERGFDGFSDVFMVSALESDGIDSIKDYLVMNAKPAKWPYSVYEWSDQTPEFLIVDSVRAKFMDFLGQELPYSITTEIEFYEVRQNPDRVITTVVVTCPSERIQKLIAGAEGGKLKQITDSAKSDLRQMFKMPVTLTISLRTDDVNNSD